MHFQIITLIITFIAKLQQLEEVNNYLETLVLI